MELFEHFLFCFQFTPEPLTLLDNVSSLKTVKNFYWELASLHLLFECRQLVIMQTFLQAMLRNRNRNRRSCNFCRSPYRRNRNRNLSESRFTIMAPVRQLICGSYVEKSTVRHVTGNDQDYLRKIPRAVVQISALL
jgi:hypothetical protein